MELVPFSVSDLDTVCEIQRAAYKPLYEKYHDDATSPYLESKETILRKYTRKDTRGFLFLREGTPVGAVRVHFDSESKIARISALGVLPRYQGQGIARQALLEIERMHPEVKTWTLDTILEERGNCHLYEKLGYRRTGEPKVLKENMTLVFYEKPCL